jgi:hypothetical protein
MRGDASGTFFMFSYFVVAIGGALGSVGRFWLSGAIAQKFGETFPVGTLLVNISGSFVIGFFAALTGPDGRIWSSPSFRQFFSDAHRKDSAALDGFADHHRNRGQRRKNPSVPARAGRNDERRDGDAGACPGD